jgi:hypothetical protein
MPISVKIGVAAGMLAFPLTLVLALRLYMGGCFFEAGCNEYEDMAIPFALAVAGAAAIFAGLVAGGLIHLVTRSRQRLDVS